MGTGARRLVGTVVGVVALVGISACGPARRPVGNTKPSTPPVAQSFRFTESINTRNRNTQTIVGVWDLTGHRIDATAGDPKSGEAEIVDDGTNVYERLTAPHDGTQVAFVDWCRPAQATPFDGIDAIPTFDVLTNLAAHGHHPTRLAHERVRGVPTVHYRVADYHASIPLDIWIDAQDRARRWVVRIATQTTTVEKYDFGVPVTLPAIHTSKTCPVLAGLP